MYKKFFFIISVSLIFSIASFSENAFGYYPTLDSETGVLTLNSTNVTGYGSFNIILQSVNDELDVFNLEEITQVQQGPLDKVPTLDIDTFTLHIPKLQLLMGKFDAQWYEVDMVIVAGDTLQFVIEKTAITTQPDDFVPSVTPEEDVSENSDTIPDEYSEDELELESSGDVTDEDRGFYDPKTRFTVKIHNLSSRWNASVSIKYQDWWTATRVSSNKINAHSTRTYWWSNNYDTDFILNYHDGRKWWRAGGTKNFRYNGWSQTVTCRLKDYYDRTWKQYLLVCDCKPGDYSASSIWW